MNYYERHLGDYAKDTGHLTMLQHGAYTLLIDKYYSRESGLPAEFVYDWAKAQTDAERQAVDSVLRQYFRLEDGVWVKNRIETEIAKAQLRIEVARSNGRRGGRPRPAEPEKPSGMPPGTRRKPGANPAKTQVKAHQAPSTKHQAPDSKHHAPDVSTLGNSLRADSPTAATNVDAERVCKRMREAGCKGASSRSPELLAAIAEGVSPKALRDAASLAVSRGVKSPFGWAIARARNQLKDREATATTAQTSLVERVRRGTR